MKLDFKHAVVGLILSSVATSPQSGWAQNSKAKAQSASIMPIRHGYYAIGRDSCANAARFANGMFFEGRYFEFVDGSAEIVSVSRSSSREYQIVERTEDEAGKFVSNPAKIRIITSDSFSLTSRDYEGRISSDTYRFCSARKPKEF